MLLLLVPELRESNASWWNIFQLKDKPQPALSYAKAVKLAAPAVVNIYSEEIQSNPNYLRSPRKINRLGSGVIMDSNGYLLTNYHVVQNANLINVLLQNGQQHHAELIGYDIYTDLAVLKVNAKNLPVIPQNVNQKSMAGDVVLAIGNPLNLGQTITQGIISATGRIGLSNTSYLHFLQMDAAINKGNSGGALVNTNGTLVGINSRQFTEINPQLNDIQGIFFAVPYQLAYKVMRQIIENGRVVRGYLGVISDHYNHTVKGFTITGIEPNGPADLAGLKIGDVVYNIAGKPIESITHALDLVAETDPETVLQFQVYRDKQSLTIPVKIIEKRGI
ncbi:trypsin-like peptidase domain-containing protein [Thalassotalea sp. G2M2-11]|uniref:trypsin-like peptidase domain-containing protein n=1 Tax=Thalassotalea sp. G2M2-11 TaxID=2787627 RepID=UPI0019D1227B|nr:trypsin-like peptidase domain-containing protein [Thalassotalea sp. G2M2-11]